MSKFPDEAGPAALHTTTSNTKVAEGTDTDNTGTATAMPRACKHCNQSFPARTLRHHQARCWRNQHRYKRVLAELAAEREPHTREFVEAHAPGETDDAIHRLLTAVHESTHAVMRHVGGLLYDRIVIYDEPTTGHADGQLITYPGQRLSTRQDHEACIVEGLASAEAEEECRRVLDRRYYVDVPDLWLSACADDYYDALHLIEAIGIEPDQMYSYLYTAQQRAHDLVMEHWSDILAVAECLLGSPLGELTFEEAAGILAYEDAIRGVDLNGL